MPYPLTNSKGQMLDEKVSTANEKANENGEPYTKNSINIVNKK